MKRYTIEQSACSHFFTVDTRSAPIWLVVRLYLGWIWISAGWEKLHDAAWVGQDAGKAISGFVQGALTKTGGAHPDVQSWYAAFLRDFVLPHAVAWSYAITWGELLVGASMIIGLLVGFATLGGMLMNLNYMLSGTVSVNPIMFTLGILLVLAWRVAGYWGLDYYVLPLFRRPSPSQNAPTGSA